MILLLVLVQVVCNVIIGIPTNRKQLESNVFEAYFKAGVQFDMGKDEF